MTTTETPKRRRALWMHALPWLITLACFAWIYRRVDAVAGDRSPLGYLAEVFAGVSWLQWLAIMLPYSVLFLLVDTLVLWRAVTWFNAKVPYTSLLPVRASAYILSLLNEQVGKGAIALYLNRTRGVPGWQVGSSMLFIMFCEFFYLLFWATLGCRSSGSGCPRSCRSFRGSPSPPCSSSPPSCGSSARRACRSAPRCASATCCARSARRTRSSTRRSSCSARRR